MIIRHTNYGFEQAVQAAVLRCGRDYTAATEAVYATYQLEAMQADQSAGSFKDTNMLANLNRGRQLLAQASQASTRYSARLEEASNAQARVMAQIRDIRTKYMGSADKSSTTPLLVAQLGWLASA